MTLSARLRRLWLDVHLWIGVGLLVAFIPLGLTGSALVWHDALDRALYADRYAVSGPSASQPIMAYAQAAESAFAHRAVLTQIRLPEEPGGPVVAVGRLEGPAGPGGRPRTLNVWIDPPTARVLASGERANSVTQILHRLHGSFMIPGVGRQIVGWMGWAMFVSCATGLWLWWPRHGGLLKALRWRRGPSSLFNLHHMVGFWVCVPLAVLSLTGVYISFPKTSHALFGAVPPPARNAPGRFAPPLADPQFDLPAAVAAALASTPGTVVGVSTPTEGREPAWRVDVNTGSQARPTSVQVVDATGQVKPGRAGSGDRRRDPTSRLMRQVHDGNGMGLVWQVVIFIAGIAPTVLGAAGVVMWLRRRSRRLALRPAVQT